MPGVGVRPAGGYFGPLHPWMTPIEESDGMLHPFGLMEDAFEGRLAPVKAWLRHFVTRLTFWGLKVTRRGTASRLCGRCCERALPSIRAGAQRRSNRGCYKS